MSDTTATKTAQLSEASYKETVESILVAFILAFIFRAFVVEAFVIPTGSMATTLYGAHMRFRCPDCGYTFDVGAHGKNSDPESDDIDIPTSVERPSNIHCPNCGYEFAPSTAAHPIDQPVRFGDRILVLKYLYLFEKPRRWDVVVFKSPSESKPPHIPEDPEYGQNYIKRLIGNPNESIVILDGDIYVAPGSAKGIESNENDNIRLAADAKDFVIQRKPAYVQERLWRIVYNNDFIPQGQVKRSSTWHQPWQPAEGTGWNAGTDDHPSRVFQFNNASAAGTLYFRADANDEKSSLPGFYPLQDWLAYDQIEDNGRDHNLVSDLKLSCFYTRKSGDGPFRIHLTKLNQCFTAEFTPGKVTLYRSTLIRPTDVDTGQSFDPGELHQIDSTDISLADNTPVQIDFSNCDYRVNLRVNGRNIFKPYEYEPDTLTLWKQALSNTQDPFARPEIRISATRQTSTIEHLSLWRDIYYGNRGDVHDYQGGMVGAFWGSPRNVIHLGEKEYFVLGDNSLISGDARYWGDPIDLPHEDLHIKGGRVPEQFMLGKAFFVYWPAGYPLPYPHINAVPDFGEMRFIH